MHETAAELTGLQRLLDASYADAGAHLKATEPETHRLTAAETCALLKGVVITDLATVSSRDTPIVAPVDGVFFHGRMWFGSAHESLRFRHIRANPAVSAAVTRGMDYSVLIHGHAGEVDTADGTHEDLFDYFIEVYGEQYRSFDYWGKAPFAWIEPRRMYATVFNRDVLTGA